jgi:hypothetical protein
MLRLRIVFVGLLIISPLLQAQEAAAHEAGADTAKLNGRSGRVRNDAQTELSFADGLQITISFLKRRHGNVTIEKTYVVTATANLADPQIRDDTRVPYQSIGRKEPNSTAPQDKGDGSKNETQYFNSNTDVDIQNVRKLNGLVQLTLRISMEGIADDVSVPPILRSHRYVISPTLSIGKQTTVYSENDVRTDTKVEIQVLVQPLNVQRNEPAKD